MGLLEDSFSEKLILRDYFQENMTSQRPFLLLRISFPGRPIFIQFIPEGELLLDDGRHLLLQPLQLPQLHEVGLSQREVVEQLDERLGEPRVRRGDDLVAEGEGHAVVHARPLAVARLQEVLPRQLFGGFIGCGKIKTFSFYHSD